MATKDSEELKSDERYPLGDYSFRIERSSVPGSTNDKIEAICTKGGKNARKSIQVPSSTELYGWYVEANEDTTDVYAVIISDQYNLVSPFIPSDLIPGNTYGRYILETISGSSNLIKTVWMDGASIVNASLTPVATSLYSPETGGWSMDYNAGSKFTYQGKTVYYGVVSATFEYWNSFGSGSRSASQQYDAPMLAWIMFYGMSGSEEEKEILVGRFAIDLEDAGGDGPGSDWDDPGDYDPDWEEGDPTHTLYVTVTGALSGRHNDPIVDPSYSYIPADKETVKDYGCGGDGGHGGGGGAGASTVVVHKFATNQANNKEVTAIARRHGYGSGGGKGGKGGDGCILVYY